MSEQLSGKPLSPPAGRKSPPGSSAGTPIPVSPSSPSSSRKRKENEVAAREAKQHEEVAKRNKALSSPSFNYGFVPPNSGPRPSFGYSPRYGYGPSYGAGFPSAYGSGYGPAQGFPSQHPSTGVLPSMSTRLSSSSSSQETLTDAAEAAKEFLKLEEKKPIRWYNNRGDIFLKLIMAGLNHYNFNVTSIDLSDLTRFQIRQLTRLINDDMQNKLLGELPWAAEVILEICTNPNMAPREQHPLPKATLDEIAKHVELTRNAASSFSSAQSFPSSFASSSLMPWPPASQSFSSALRPSHSSSSAFSSPTLPPSPWSSSPPTTLLTEATLTALGKNMGRSGAIASASQPLTASSSFSQPSFGAQPISTQSPALLSYSSALPSWSGPTKFAASSSSSSAGLGAVKRRLPIPPPIMGIPAPNFLPPDPKRARLITRLDQPIFSKPTLALTYPPESLQHPLRPGIVTPEDKRHRPEWKHETDWYTPTLAAPGTIEHLKHKLYEGVFIRMYGLRADPHLALSDQDLRCASFPTEVLLLKDPTRNRALNLGPFPKTADPRQVYSAASQVSEIYNPALPISPTNSSGLTFFREIKADHKRGADKAWKLVTKKDSASFYSTQITKFVPFDNPYNPYIIGTIEDVELVETNDDYNWDRNRQTFRKPTLDQIPSAQQLKSHPIKEIRRRVLERDKKGETIRWTESLIRRNKNAKLGVFTRVDDEQARLLLFDARQQLLKQLNIRVPMVYMPLQKGVVVEITEDRIVEDVIHILAAGASNPNGALLEDYLLAGHFVPDSELAEKLLAAIERTNLEELNLSLRARILIQLLEHESNNIEGLLDLIGMQNIRNYEWQFLLLSLADSEDLLDFITREEGPAQFIRYLMDTTATQPKDLTKQKLLVEAFLAECKDQVDENNLTAIFSVLKNLGLEPESIHLIISHCIECNYPNVLMDIALTANGQKALETWRDPRDNSNFLHHLAKSSESCAVILDQLIKNQESLSLTLATTLDNNKQSPIDLASDLSDPNTEFLEQLARSAKRYKQDGLENTVNETLSHLRTTQLSNAKSKDKAKMDFKFDSHAPRAKVVSKGKSGKGGKIGGFWSESRYWLETEHNEYQHRDASSASSSQSSAMAGGEDEGEAAQAESLVLG